MSQPPLVTVLMPVFNGARFLRAAIDSVLASTFLDFELLIIDDGSTDGSPGILASYSDPRMRVVNNPTNLGLIASLNHGLDIAQGRYVARMDADDLMLPQRLERQVETLESDLGLSMVASTIEFINADDKVTGTWDTDRATTSEASIRAMLPRTNCIAHPSVMLRRSAFEALRYSPQQPNAEDWDLWMRVLANGGRIAKLPEVLLRYRVHPSSIMAGQKALVPLSVRLLTTRRRFLRKRPLFGLATAFDRSVWTAQLRTRASRLLRELAPRFARDAYRICTYAPWKLAREQHELKTALQAWTGRHLFNFPYFGIGGAERVHADIVATVSEHAPLIIISGFSGSDANRAPFERAGRTIEIPRLLHHPFTRRKAHARIAAALNERDQPVLFASLSAVFFDLIPQLQPKVRCLYLQHAFLFQPTGNAQHKQWLRLFPRIEAIVFVSGQARKEYDRFLFTNNIPLTERKKLLLVPNAVHRFGGVRVHERIGVLFVGRDSAEKRLDLFLELAQRVEEARPGLVHFTAVGPALRTAGTVEFTGPITDPDRLAAIYAEHDILAVTSHREGFPLVIMEAMAQGLAIMSTPVGDVPNRLKPDVAYLTTSVERDQVVSEMARWLVGMVDDGAGLVGMRRAALLQARSEFGMEAFVQRYRALLTSPTAST